MRERYLSRTAVERELAISARDRRERAGRARAAPGVVRRAPRRGAGRRASSELRVRSPPSSQLLAKL